MNHSQPLTSSTGPASGSIAISPTLPLIKNYFHPPTPTTAGPTNGTYLIPPRPKPGRKPATDEPQTKRKAQNREAQRAFRARKVRKLEDLEWRYKALEDDISSERNAWAAEQENCASEMQKQVEQIAQLTTEVERTKEQLRIALGQREKLQEDRDLWKSRADNLNLRMKRLPTNMKNLRDPNLSKAAGPARSTPLMLAPQSPQPPADGCGKCQDDGECPCIDHLINLGVPDSGAAAQVPASPLTDIPMNDGRGADNVDYAEREMDFTTKRPDFEKSVSIGFIGSTPSIDDKCGFCTDADNCICATEAAAKQAQYAAEESVASESSSPGIARLPSRKSAKPTPKAGPGTCERCQSDPAQRAWCQNVAKYGRTELFPPNSSPTSSPSSLQRHRPTPSSTAPSSLPCNDAYAILKRKLPTDFSERDYAPDLVLKSTTEFSRRYSAYDIECASIMGVLSQGTIRHPSVQQSQLHQYRHQRPWVDGAPASPTSPPVDITTSMEVGAEKIGIDRVLNVGEGERRGMESPPASRASSIGVGRSPISNVLN